MVWKPFLFLLRHTPHVPRYLVQYSPEQVLLAVGLINDLSTSSVDFTCIFKGLLAMDPQYLGMGEVYVLDMRYSHLSPLGNLYHVLDTCPTLQRILDLHLPETDTNLQP